MIDENLLGKSLAYQQLYVKYLGTLTVLGRLASKVDVPGPDMCEELEACRDDAEAFLKPHLRFIDSGDGFYMETTR